MNKKQSFITISATLIICIVAQYFLHTDEIKIAFSIINYFSIAALVVSLYYIIHGK